MIMRTAYLRIWPVMGVLAGLTGAGLGVRGETAERNDYPIRQVPFTEVRIEDGFWSPRLETNRVVTIPYAFEQCEATGRIANFAIAGGIEEGKFRGIFFNDSDVFKVIEGAAYALANHPDAELEGYVDGVIAKIAAAQEPDGYLYTARTLCGPDYMPPGGPERWSDIAGGHELYNVGHLYEAAVAYYQATGKPRLLEVARKNADLICREFGPGRKAFPPGHEQIEIGLARLFRLTGEAKYLDMAKFFLDARGRAGDHPLYGSYSQDHLPVVEQSQAVGHAVRAAYLYTGMADIAALTGDQSYVRAIGRLWNDVVRGKLYVTGGIGAHGAGEAFGAAYELPNRTAYCETCAAVANAMWNHRMFLMHGEGRYVDVLERVIYNGFLSGVSMEGNRFFYPNRLASYSGEERSPWFSCACCPANIVRFVPSIPGYAYAHRDDVLYVNLFLGGSARVPVGDQSVKVRQQTRYPWDGAVHLAVEPEYRSEFEVAVRIPGWARNEPVPSSLYRFSEPSDAEVRIEVNGRLADWKLEEGFARIRREWNAGDVMEIHLPMEVRRVLANPEVEADRGRVALQRGPLVYCVEGWDSPEAGIFQLVLGDENPLQARFEADLLKGVETITGTAGVARRRMDGSIEVPRMAHFSAIPYYAWAHRGRSPMTVWLAREASSASPLPAPTLAATSAVRTSGGTDPGAINDQLEPSESGDHTFPYFHWWPRKGSTEWVEYHLDEPAEVAAVEVYWFDDTGVGECRVPAAWRLFARIGGRWQPVSNPSPFGTAPDTYNRTTFDPVRTDALRLEVDLREKFSTGIHEWKIDPADFSVAAPSGTKQSLNGQP